MTKILQLVPCIILTVHLGSNTNKCRLQREEVTIVEKRKDIPWWAEGGGLFGAGYLKEYAEVVPQGRTQKEVDFLKNTLKLKPGVKILDLACGHGRHALRLACMGCDVTGVDINSFFLKEAGKAARKAGAKIELVQGDMRSIPVDGPFDAALNLFTAFGYFDSDEEDEKVIHEVARILIPGGKFVLDVMNKERLMRVFKEKDWERLSDGSIILRERTFDLISGRNYERRMRYWADGEKEEVQISLRLYTLAELIAMVRRAGLELSEVYGDFDGNPITLDSPRCILIVQKK